MAVTDPQIIHFSLNSVPPYGPLDHNGIPMYDFSSPPFESPLVPPDFQWHKIELTPPCIPSPPESESSSHAPTPSTSDENSTTISSDLPFPSSFPSSAALASMPIPFSRGYSRNKDPDHVPRPRNAFMLFRSAFAAAHKIGTNIERDNRHITRIIAHCWNRLSDSEKQVWRNKAATEKAIHAMKYPNYRFHPIVRAQKPAKRKVRRNGTEDKRRCEQVAELLLAGKRGEELEVAVKEIDDSLKVPASGSSSETRRGSVSKALQGWESRDSDSEGCDIQPFRSPLLPPAKSLQTYDLTAATPVSQPLTTTTINSTPQSYDYSNHYQAHDVYQPTSCTLQQEHPLLLTQPDCYALPQCSRLSPLPATFYSEPIDPFMNYLGKNIDDNISALAFFPPELPSLSWDTLSTSGYDLNMSVPYTTFPSY